MLTKLKQSWIKLPPKQRKLFAVVGIFAGVFLLIAVFQGDAPKREASYNKKTDQVRNVLTDRGDRNAGLDHISGRVKKLDSRSENLEREVERLTEEAKDKTQLQQLEKKFNTRLEQLTRQVNELKAERDHLLANSGAKAGGQDEQVDFTAMSTDDVRYDAKGTGSAKPKKESRPMIRVFNNAKTDDSTKGASRRGKKEKAVDAEAYIPAGSILTGTIITGGDFATNAGGYDNPTPLLIRISKEAILPNRFRTDIRECFLLMGGRGDLSSERVKLRGEMLSCARKDGSVIETKLNSYVTGEDGKEGIKGRLVSKQGQIIARSLMAGFASGLSEAFDVNQVPTISTSSDGTVEYSKVYSSDALQGAAVKGFSNSLERISEFYLDMAKDIFPVVEVNAGRQVDVIVISGTKLKVTAENVK